MSKQEDRILLIHEMIQANNGMPEWVNIGNAIKKSPEAARAFYRRHKDKYVNEIQENIGVKMEGSNQIEITSEHDSITTPEELYKYCKIDLDEWVVYKVEITKSTKSIAKGLEKDLQWDDGIMSGYNKRGETLLVPVVRIKSTLIKKHPDSIEPVVQPIQLSAEVKEPKPIKTNKSVTRWLIGGDEQIGFERDGGKIITYHDRRAMDIFAQVAKDWSWDGILLLGDLIDWTEFSTYTLTPNQYGFSQSSACEGHFHLKRLRNGSPDTPIKWLLGNHGDRPRKAVEKNIQGLWDLKLPEDIKLNLPPIYHPARLLGADALHIDWSENYPDGEVWLSPDIRGIHGERYKQGLTSVMVRDSEYSTIQGHGHNAEVTYHTRHTSFGKKYIMALANGCLCKVGGEVPGRKKRSNWQQTFAVVEFYEDIPVPTVTIVPIVDGKAIFGGMIYEGQDYRDELIKDTGWEVF